MSFGFIKILLDTPVFIPPKLLNTVNVGLKVLDRFGLVSSSHTPHHLKRDALDKCLYGHIISCNRFFTAPVVENPAILFQPDKNADRRALCRRQSPDAPGDDILWMPMRQQGFQS